jgi:hypothetical protein
MLWHTTIQVGLVLCARHPTCFGIPTIHPLRSRGSGGFSRVKVTVNGQPGALQGLANPDSEGSVTTTIESHRPFGGVFASKSMQSTSRHHVEFEHPSQYTAGPVPGTANNRVCRDSDVCHVASVCAGESFSDEKVRVAESCIFGAQAD